MLCWNCGKTIEDGTVCPNCGIDNKKKEKNIEEKTTLEKTDTPPSICKNCGNALASGTYCVRCGTENDENAHNEQVIEAENDIIPENRDSKRASRIIIELLIVYIGLILPMSILGTMMCATADGEGGAPDSFVCNNNGTFMRIVLVSTIVLIGCTVSSRIMKKGYISFSSIEFILAVTVYIVYAIMLCVL